MSQIPSFDGGFISAILLVFLLVGCGHKTEPAASSEEILGVGFVGSKSCRDCHTEAYAAWANSHHALAERLPSVGLDEAAFSPARTFTLGSQLTTVRGQQGSYELLTAGLHGSNQTFAVERVLAHSPLRQMLIEFPGGRLQATEAAWDPRSNQWFDVYGQEDRKPGEWGHWTGRGMNWNSMCADCHNTAVQKNYDSGTDTYHTTMVENGVGCESCHGPMKAHNDWQAVNKGKGLKDPTVRKFSRDEMFETCAACHARRAELTGQGGPGDRFFDHYQLSLPDHTDLFYPDGQIRDEDYEVSAFMGSRMFHKGVRCADCHDFHAMKPRLPGNLLCLSCHGPGATNAPVIDPVKHSHHKVFGYDTNGAYLGVDLGLYKPSTIKETGGECVNCHMPQTVYMQRHWRHDHGFTIPDPLLTVKFGVPNACNRCHADKDASWSLQQVQQWYGDKMDRPYRQRAEVFSRAKQGDPGAKEPLVKLLETEENPYWRAVAANFLAQWVDDMQVSEALLRQTRHTNALVRQATLQALAPLAQAGRDDVSARLFQLAEDPSRNVRVEAARQLGAALAPDSTAAKEYGAFLAHCADQPLGQLQAGIYALQRGDTNLALGHFDKAVTWDPFSPGLRHEYAVMLSQLGQGAEAVRQLEAAVKLAPNDADSHFSLALALNETGETNRVISELEAAVKCDGRHAQAWYNLGLAYNVRGNTAAALAALAAAGTNAADNPIIPYAQATILYQAGRFEEARNSANRALGVSPNFQPAQALLRVLDTK